MRKVSLMVASAVLGATAATTVLKTGLLAGSPANAAAADTYRNLNLFGDVFEKIRTDYVEKPDEEKLVEAAINGMLASLDPHSSYMDAKSYRDMQVQTRGEFGGLGIEVTQEDGNIKVVTPIDDTPASKAGILSGDLIVAIDGDAVSGLSLNQAVDKMRGAVGTSVVLKIQRAKAKDTQDFKLTRAVITIKSVKNDIKDDVGYIRITQFNEQTFDGLKTAMAKFQSDIPADKFKGYILDLRNNPGGLLDQSIEVANSFIDRGEIVSTRGRNADETQRYNGAAGWRSVARQADGGADQRRVGLGLGDRRRRPAGPQARHDHGYAVLRQGIGADHYSARPERRASPDDRPLLHAVRSLDPGQGHRTRGADLGGRAGRPEGQGRHQGRGIAQGPSDERRGDG